MFWHSNKIREKVRMTEEQDKCCHTLTELQGLRKLQPPLKSTTQAVHAQTLTTTPPGGPHKSTLKFTSESHEMDQSLEMENSPSPGKKLNRVINTLLGAKCQGKPNSSSTLPSDENPLIKSHNYVNYDSSFPIDKILRKSHNSTMDLNSSSGASSQEDLSDNSFEILTSHSDERTPYSLKKVASNSREIHHSGPIVKRSPPNEDLDSEQPPIPIPNFDPSKDPYLRYLQSHNHDIGNRSRWEIFNGNDKDDFNSSGPNNPNDIELKSYIKSRKEQMTLNIQPLKISESFDKSNGDKNSQFHKNLENQTQEDYTIPTATGIDDIQQNNNSENLQWDCLPKNENIHISQISQMAKIQRIQQDTISKNLELKCFSKNKNIDISQNSKITDTKNWQHDNCTSRSSHPQDLEEAIKNESPERDTSIQSPTLFTILNEGVNYRDGHLIDPCNTRKNLRSVRIKKPDFNKATKNYSPASLLSCKLNDNVDTFHKYEARQETEMIRQTTTDDHDQIENRTPNEENPILHSSAHLQQQEKRVKKCARNYSFRDGQHPYTAIFISFAPPSTALAAQVREANATTGANAASMGANATAARAILTKIAQKPPTKAEYNAQVQEFSHSFLSDYTRQVAPDTLRPWLPRKKSFIPIPQQKQPETFHHWYSTHRTGVNNALDEFDQDFMNDIRNEIDKEIDRIQEFNDKILDINGFNMVPYMGLPMDVFAGSFRAELTTGLALYVCKPCDMAGFLKSNFILHHESHKHQHNIRIWILQHYIPPTLNNTQQYQPTKEEVPTKDDGNHSIIYPENYQPSKPELNPSKELEKIMKKINASYFPAKYRQDVAGLMTEFFVSTNNIEVGFTKEFKEARDHTGDRHWIILAFEFLQQQQDPRQYMKDKLIQHDLEFCEKSPVQQNEVKFISDLARMLFLLCINCEFVPTNYIIMLAIIMTKKNKLNYPESNTGLFNAHYLDLFLNVGAMTLSYKNDIRIDTDQNDLSQLIDGEKIETKEEDPDPSYSGEQIPAINTGSRAWTWTSEEPKTGKQDTEEFIAGIQGITDEDLILHGPLSEDIKILNKTNNQVTNDGIDTDLEYIHKLAEGNQALSCYDGQSSTSSSCSIPSLEDFNYHKNNIPSFSSKPSTSTSTGISSQNKHHLKSPHQKNAIYIRNLRPGIKYKELLKIWKEFGPIKRIIMTGKFKKDAIVIFNNKSNAKLALNTMNGKFIEQPLADGIRGAPLDVQYAFRQGLINKGILKNPSKPSTPLKTKSITNGLQEFNNSSYFIHSTENVTIPKYSNKEIKVKLFNKNSPNEIISNTTVSISCGLAPQIQLSEGIFEVTNSTTIIAIRNNANYPLKIKNHQLIKGTDCHLRSYVNNNTIKKNVCYSSYHLQCKTYKRMNQFHNEAQKASSTKHENNQNIKEDNQWIMQ